MVHQNSRIGKSFLLAFVSLAIPNGGSLDHICGTMYAMDKADDSPQSGLTQAVQHSKHEMDQVEADLLLHLQQLGCQPKTLVLAGNSIHADRMFLTLQMPTLTEFLYVTRLDTGLMPNST